MTNFRKYASSTVFRNFVYLNLTQVINYIFPFVTFPYVSRIFSQDNYGLIITATAFASYLGLFTDFGFNLSATRDIAKEAKENSLAINRIFNSVITAKIVLYFVFLIPLCGFIFISDKYSRHASIFMWYFAGVFGNLLFPTWYFQATNNMQNIAKFNLLSRVLGVLLLFLIVRNNDDLLNFAIMNAVISLIIGVLAIYIVISKYHIHLKLSFKFTALLVTIKEGFASFTAVLLISFYTTFNSLLLSWFCGYKDVAIYGVADKIIGIVLTVQGALIQAVYPSITAEEQGSIIKHKTLKLFRYNIFLGVMICVFLNLFAPLIIHIFTGHKYDLSIPVLRILSLVPIIMAFSSALSTYCFALKKERYQVYAYIIGVIYCIMANLILIKNYTYFAVSYNYLLCEIISLFALYLFIKNIKSR